MIAEKTSAAIAKEGSGSSERRREDGSSDSSSLLVGLASTVAVLLPMLLLLDLRTTFVCDWLNDVWMVNYVSEYFNHHLRFPAVFNTQTITGMAYPVFYGYLLFPLLSLLSVPWDGSIAIRLCCAAVWTLQFVVFYRLGVKLSQNRFFAFSLAALVIWCIYPMTNLYNRGAVPEFVATGCMFSAFALWFEAVLTEQSLKRFLSCNASVFCMALAAGAHPITAVYGGIFYLCMVALTTWMHGFKRTLPVLKAMIVPAALAVLCLMPWAMATKKFVRQITVSRFDQVQYYPATLDSPFARLTPFPVPSAYYDEYMIKEKVATLHLDTQISIPLLLLFLGLVAYLGARRQLGANKLTASLVFLTAATIWLTYLSLYRGSLDHLGYFARSIQFSYRLVTYINLSIVTALLMALCFRSDRTKPIDFGKISPLLRPLGTAFLLMLLVVGATGAIIKLRHGSETTVFARHPIWQRPKPDVLLQLPDTFYGHYAYTTFKDRPLLDEKHTPFLRYTFVPDAGKNFGEVAPRVIPVTDKMLLTNVHSFEWNGLFLDGKQVTDPALLPHAEMMTAVKPLAKEISYQFCPDRTWQVLNAIALPLFLTWLALTAASPLAALCGAPANEVRR